VREVPDSEAGSGETAPGPMTALGRCRERPGAADENSQITHDRVGDLRDLSG